MQALILASGRGTRMGELTSDTPKPLLQVAGKSLIEHKLEALPSAVDEVVVVVGYQGDAIKECFRDESHGRRIVYVQQEILDGTAKGVWAAKDVLHDRFLVLMGDDLYCREDMECCILTPDWSMVVAPVGAMGAGGRVEVDQRGVITGIEEGDHEGRPGLVGTNLFVLDTRFFDMPPVPKAPGSEEYGLPQTAVMISTAEAIPFHAIETRFWHQVTSPEDLIEAEKRLSVVK
ncbi:MAG: sugar phosphate nucleotidyltransferase [Candidatus Paceibacterota bacterium]